MKKFKRFPMILMSVLAFMAVTSLTGCESSEEKELRLDREHEIRMAREENGSAEASRERSHERSLAYIQRPIAPGNYIDYRGNLSHGYWNSGSWMWNDPRSGYATQSSHYVDYQMSMGLLSTAVLTQALFNRNNSGGWQSTNVQVNNYTSISGKTISKKKYKKRNKSLTKKKKAQAKKRKKLKAKQPKTVSKSTGIKKDDKWKSKRDTKSTYAKGGFKDKFAKNKAKSSDNKLSARDKRRLAKPRRQAPNSNYGKNKNYEAPKPPKRTKKKQQRPKKQKRRN